MTHRHKCYKHYAQNRLRNKLAKLKRTNKMIDPEDFLGFIEENVADILKANIDGVKVAIDDLIESGLGDILLDGNVHIGTVQDNKLM